MTDAAEVDELDARPFFRVPKSMKLTDSRTQFAVAAASMALRDAGLETGHFDADRAGVILGSSGSDLRVEELARALKGCDAGDPAVFGRQILSGLNPLWLLINLPNMVSAHVSIQFDLRGPNSTVMTDWIAGIQSMGEAASWIENGEADVVVCGGADCGVLPFVLSNYEERMQFHPADGAALFVLEEREYALRRGAPVRGEIVSSAFGPATDDGDGNSLALTMGDALDRAGWSAEDVSSFLPARVPHDDYRDFESAAAELTFGRFRPRWTPSTREALGFPLAAASAIDIAIQLRSDLQNREEKMIANSLGFTRQAASLCIAREARA